MWRVVAPPVAFAAFASQLSTHSHSLRASRALRDRLPPVHNLCLSLYSLAVGVAVTAHWSRARLPSVCRPVTHHPPLAPWVVESWYWSKIWEWADTAILVARGRRVSRLHFFHHMSTASLVALQTAHGTTTPLFEVGTALNAYVHFGMYLYYAFPRALRPVRRWITLSQIAQHGVMTACILYSVVDRFALGGECVADDTGNLVPLVLYLFFLVEFSRIG